jgi:hypothetical protein
MSHLERYRARVKTRRRRLRIALGVLVGLTVTVGLGAWLLTPTPLRAKTLGGNVKAAPRKTPGAATTGSGAAPAPVAPASVEPASTTPAAPALPPSPLATPPPQGPGVQAPTASLPPTSDAPAVPGPSVPKLRGVTGRVLDAGRKPIARASVVAAGGEHFTDPQGVFTIEALPPQTKLLLKAPGFHRATVEAASGPFDVVLREHAVKAAYLTYYGIGDKTIRGRVLDLVARTELNAVVIDVKGDRGLIPYVTEVPLALEAGAQGPVMLKDVEGLLADLKQRGVYTIARVVVFKDTILAGHRRDLAIIDTRTGRPWIDNEKLAWVDPFRTEIWDYNIAIAREAVRKGFDEVQFDYVRFPTDGRLAAARYAKANTKENRLAAIADFLERARRALGPSGAFVAADIFGYTAFNENDTDIGQRLEELAPHVDYLCPMVYPSGYHVGIPGTRNPVANPYRVVYESVRLTRQRTAAATVRIRPWLQDFRDYAFDRRIFGPSEVRAQIKAAQDAGASGWMLWNPKNDYTGGALAPEKSLAAR